MTKLSEKHSINNTSEITNLVNKNNICSKCLWFYDRDESCTPSKLDVITLEYLNTNSILLSDWFINNIIYGHVAH